MAPSLSHLEIPGPFTNFPNSIFTVKNISFVILPSFLVAQLVKNLPAMRETWVQSLGWEDPLEKGIPTAVFWPGEFHGLYSPWVHKDSDMTEQLSLSDRCGLKPISFYD